MMQTQYLPGQKVRLLKDLTGWGEEIRKFEGKEVMIGKKYFVGFLNFEPEDVTTEEAKASWKNRDGTIYIKPNAISMAVRKEGKAVSVPISGGKLSAKMWYGEKYPTVSIRYVKDGEENDIGSDILRVTNSKFSCNARGNLFAIPCVHGGRVEKMPFQYKIRDENYSSSAMLVRKDWDQRNSFNMRIPDGLVCFKEVFTPEWRGIACCYKPDWEKQWNKMCSVVVSSRNGSIVRTFYQKNGEVVEGPHYDLYDLTRYLI